MKKYHYVFGMLLSMSITLSSCLGEGSSEVSLYDDAVITSFTLGTLTQYKPGTDEVVTTFSGSTYPMSIDQLNGRIFNRTPLPVGTRINDVLCTIGTLNNGAVALQNLTDEYFNWHNSSVGVDFSKDSTRTFRIFASDASCYRDYKVKITIASSEGTNFSWGDPVADTTLLKGFSDMRLVAISGKRMLALCGDGSQTVVRTSADNGTTWNDPSTAPALADSAWASAVVKDSTLYLLSNGLIYSTKNGEEWNSITAAPELKQLVATSTGELFALCKDNTLEASADNGLTWTTQTFEEGLPTDSAKTLLNMKDIASTTFNYPASYHADYVLMVGNNGNNTVVWRKIAHYDPIKATDTWSNIPQEGINKFRLPVRHHLSLVHFDDTVLAFADGTSAFQTTDQGITWKDNSTYALPLGEPIRCVAVDGDGRLMAISQGGKVYRGIKY